MMMTRRSERMSRPSRMAPGMQVQSAIASAPACGRVCTQLSCLILHAPRLASTTPAAQRPFTPACCAADTAASQPSAGHCVSMRARRVRRNPRARAPRTGPIGARRPIGALAAVPLRPGTLAAARMPRGWSDVTNRPANRPAIPPKAVGLFGRALSRITGLAHRLRAPACAGRRRWAHVCRCPWGELVNSRLPWRVVYIFVPSAPRPLYMPPPPDRETCLPP